MLNSCPYEHIAVPNNIPTGSLNVALVKKQRGCSTWERSRLAWQLNDGRRGRDHYLTLSSRTLMSILWCSPVDSPLNQLSQDSAPLFRPHPLPSPPRNTCCSGPVHEGRKVCSEQPWAWLPPSCFSSWFCEVFQALLPHPIFCPGHFLISLVVTISSITYMFSHVADSFRRSNMKGTTNDGTYSPDYSLASVDLKSFKNNLVDIIQQNKERWKELAAQGTVVYEAFLPSLSVLTPPLRCWIVFLPRFPLLQNMQALRGIYNLAIHKKIGYS